LSEESWRTASATAADEGWFVSKYACQTFCGESFDAMSEETGIFAATAGRGAIVDRVLERRASRAGLPFGFTRIARLPSLGEINAR
jgi:hypothetical protein